jgi:hypothetical protein
MAFQVEMFKQLIQQKFATRENIRSPFINDLRLKWRERVSKSDSWANKLQAGEWKPEEEEKYVFSLFFFYLIV